MTPDAVAPAVSVGNAPALLELRDVVVDFPLRRSIQARIRRLPAPVLRAVDGVSLSVSTGEVVGLAGESGSGKSTLARSIAGIQAATSGEIRYRDVPLQAGSSRERAGEMQLVFQDPSSSLNPSMRVGTMLRELVRLHHGASPTEAAQRVGELLAQVGLSSETVGLLPRQMSGGQRQRVAIARALACDPALLVADEPTSALDVSVQAGVLNLLAELRDRLDLTILLVSHNLAVIRRMCDRLAIMYLGSIVEEGPAEEILGAPAHPYTAALISAVPQLAIDERGERAQLVSGEPPSPTDLPAGCRFHPRCPRAQEVCRTDPGPALQGTGARRVACHFPLDGVSHSQFEGEGS
jgi:peptide/nickel transport system ATP-binding protein